MGPQYGTIEKFEGKNFMLWKFKVETLFKAKELWGLVSGKEVKPNPINVLILLVYEEGEKNLESPCSSPFFHECQKGNNNQGDLGVLLKVPC